MHRGCMQCVRQGPLISSIVRCCCVHYYLAGMHDRMQARQLDAVSGHRSSIPVVTALLAIVVEGKVPSSFEAAALGILVAGVMTAIWEGARGSITGATSSPPVPLLLLACTPCKPGNSACLLYTQCSVVMAQPQHLVYASDRRHGASTRVGSEVKPSAVQLR